MSRPPSATIRCNYCSFSYQAPVFNIIDVGQVPELKQYFLSGMLNASQCPNCRNVNVIATPLLYHDPSHDFLGLYIPSQVGANPGQRQKLIGDLTKALMNSVPAEQRRGYMLTPQEFLTMDSMVERVLGFDGITPEMIAASRKKVELVPQLARLKDDPLAFAAAVKDNEALLDREFFLVLTNLIASAQQDGRTAEVEQMVALREKLIPITEFGQRLQRQRQAVARLGEAPTRADVLDAIIAGDMDEVEAITMAARPLIDYEFYQALTERIEASSGEERKALEEKRALIVQIDDYLRQSDTQVMQAASEVLQALLSAEDLDQAIAELLPYIDQNVMSLLMSNIADAEQHGADAAVMRLREVWDKLVAAIEQEVPPPVRLVYALLDAEYPEETRAILREHKSEVTPEFIETLKDTLKQIEQTAANDPDQAEIAHHLRNVITQAQLGA